MQSTLANAVTISSITKAAPGVVTTASAHGLANGDVVLPSTQGMVELNGRLFKVVSSSGSTLGMADVDGVTGIDTTNYNTFTSGSLQKVTLGTSITGVQDFSFGAATSRPSIPPRCTTCKTPRSSSAPTPCPPT